MEQEDKKAGGEPLRPRVSLGFSIYSSSNSPLSLLL
jgi:hypothetical protein